VPHRHRRLMRQPYQRWRPVVPAGLVSVASAVGSPVIDGRVFLVVATVCVGAVAATLGALLVMSLVPPYSA
jgi:hypothetical protein